MQTKQVLAKKKRVLAKIGSIFKDVLIGTGIALVLFTLLFWFWQWGCTGQFIFWTVR